jgi:hypothetical protein
MKFGRYAGMTAVLVVLTVRTPAAAQNLAPPHASIHAVSRALIEPARRLNILAWFCAGMEVDRRSDLYDLTQTDDWTKFAAGENARWAAFKKTEVKVMAWAQAELHPHKPANPSVFYPFGGPDILFPCLLMPSSRLYVLVGLEPVGSPPDPEAIRRLPLVDFLTQYSLALDDIIRLSFFRRADLKTELATPVIDGVLPILMVLLVRTEREIVSVERGTLSPRGEFVRAGEDPQRKPRALRLRFRERGRGPTHTLIYLSQDLSNPAVDSNRGFRAYIEKNLAHSFGYIKSASYQMHKPVFSSIARLILSVSDVVLEDDSSIPYRLFDPDVWKITLYGAYAGPIELFKESFQQDLFDAYAKGAKRLDFHIGYGKKSNLLLAVRKTA